MDPVTDLGAVAGARPERPGLDLSIEARLDGRGDLAGRAGPLDGSVRGDPDAQRHVAEAQAAYERADFEQALRSYSRVLEHDPLHVPAWAGQVRALIELGEFQEARLWADKALERFPTEPELLAA